MACRKYTELFKVIIPVNADWCIVRAAICLETTLYGREPSRARYCIYHLARVPFRLFFDYPPVDSNLEILVELSGGPHFYLANNIISSK